MKQLILPLILSPLLFAQCTPMQEREAKRIWTESVHTQGNAKLKLLNKAEKLCPLEIIAIDKQIVEVAKNPTLRSLSKLKHANNLLLVSVDEITHKHNNKKIIDQLFLDYFLKEKQQLNSKKSAFLGNDDKSELSKIEQRISLLKGQVQPNSPKAVGKIGGTYKADLLFDKAMYQIKNHTLTNEIITVIDEEVKKDNNAFFGLEGGASSEGSHDFNHKLSKNRAQALQKEILDKYPHYRKNIKVFAMGESELVCEGDLLPEKNANGEYTCLTQENRELSRRVVIRRVR